MKSTAAIHTSVKQEWREKLLRNGVAAYYPLYALFRKNHRTFSFCLVLILHTTAF